MQSHKRLGALASAAAACLLLAACSGGGGSSTGPAAPAPYILASLISFPTGAVPSGFVPPGFNTGASVQVLDNSNGAPIANASVSINGVTLNYSALNQDYEGSIAVAPGGSVALSVNVGGATYTGSATQFTSYPVISAPAAGATLSSGAANLVAWSGGAPTTNSVYVLGVLDSADPNGPLVWPARNSIQVLPTSTTSFTIDPSSLSVGNRLVMVGIAAALDMPSAAPNSGIVIGGFGYVPVTVSSTGSTPPPGPGPVNPPPAGLWQPSAGSTPATGNFVYLQSDSGDFIGAGQTYTYTQVDSALSVVASGGRLSVRVTGDKQWGGDFQAMNSLSQLQPGYYADLQRYPFNDPAKGGLNWSGDGRGCNTLQGWFVVDNVTYAGSALASVDLRFEQHCEGDTPALHGAIHWTSSDTTTPPGPVNPPPAGLWQPAPGSTPATGNFVYLQSDPGDFIGAGQTRTYTQATAILSINAGGGHLSVGVSGDTSWSGEFQTMNTLSQLQPGYYGGLVRYPFNNPAKGGLDWSGDGRGCNTLQGWFVVDNVTYVTGTLTAIDLRFEQHCEGATPALHGAIHWTSTDATTPTGPINPPPAGLWQPAPGSTPATGNFVYLKSDLGDYIGLGQTYTYTQATAILSINASGGHLSVNINGDQQWFADFQTMNTLSQFQPGYYGGLERYPFNNPAKGGLSWYGEGRGCNTLLGWFAVDNVTYLNGVLTAIDLRFEQHCEGGSSALRGAIHWSSGDTTTPPGPVNPPPAGLWQPAPGATPATGSFVYLQSDVGDYIGQGQTYTYTQATAILSVNANVGLLAVGVNGDQQWTGDFQAMNSLSQFQPGYYGGLQRYPFNNPAKGGLDWSGEGRGCNTEQGWFVVDNVTYVNGVLTAIDLRFEQHCEGGSSALRGAIHWNSGDTTTPPGPVNPPPAGLWQPAPGATPATGNFVYLQSDVGDYIGQGQTYLYTPSNATLVVNATGGHLSINVGSYTWNGDFQTMNTLSQFQIGYYGGLERYPFHNPAKGGLSWYGEGRGCNTLLGWFVVDNVTYFNGFLTSIDLRFEQHCEGGTPALHGRIRWAG
ncbi:MAG TPA: hypothetical protein VEM34_10515 [Burkholderiales bacterium]|nr:hypothetical protein [Burkholderiales bacterium]